MKQLVFLTLLVGSVAYSQPYYYYFRYNPGYEVPGYSGDVYRLNLATNSDELFAKNVGRVNGEVFSNSEQSAIFFQVRFSLVAIDVNDPSRHQKEFLNGINEVLDAKDSPKTNRYYISFWDMQDSALTVAFDRSTLQPTDTIFEQITPYNSFLSENQDGLYRLQDDSTGIFFSEYIINQKRQATPQRCGNLGPFVGGPGQDDGGSGYALVSYTDNLDMNLVRRNLKYAFLSQRYVLCNVDQNATFTPISFAWRSDGFLSADRRYIILEEVDWDTTRAGGEYRPGIVYVFDGSDGELTQRLTLPPGGKILVFDNYPQMFYYYNDSTNQSISVNVSTVTPTDVLIDTLISLKHQAVANGWLKEGRSYQRDCDEMMRDKDWYKKGEFKKFRSWEADDSWDFDKDWNSGIARVLDRRLNRAKEALSRGDSVRARRDLEIFEMEVELLNNISRKLEARKQAPVLTLDAYTLLKYNAEYLIARLPERHGRGIEGEGREKR